MWASLAFAVLLAAAPPAGAADDVLAEVMRELAAVTSSRATFVETKQSALLKEALVLRGTLAYRRPDFLEKRVREPHEERITMEGERITLESSTPPRIVTLRAAGVSPVAALVAGMRAARAGDLALLETHFRVAAEGRSEAWVMRLTPRSPQVQGYVTAIAIHGMRGRISRVEVEESSGDRSVMRIEEVLE